MNDQETIHAALDNLTENGTLTLYDGTYINSSIVMTCQKTLIGSGNTVLSGGNGVQMSAGGTVANIHLKGTTYGINCADYCTVRNITANDIRDTVNGFAAIVHVASVHNVSIDDVTGIDCDRGIEVENGASYIDVSNINLENIYSLVQDYSFSLDAHTHIGRGVVHHITYTDCTLTNCVGATVAGVPNDNRVTDVTMTNITINGLYPSNYIYALLAMEADRVNFINVTMVDVPEDKRACEQNCTDVVFDIN